MEEFQRLEEDYARKTGIIPIMHTLVVRSEIAESYPWGLRNLFLAFDEARRRSIARVTSKISTRVPVLWLSGQVDRTKGGFGDEYWPYGVEENRTTLEAFLLYAYEQGICSRLMIADEIFPEQVLPRGPV